MAGGWGEGKTFALRNEPSVTPDLVWDGTLSETPWAVEMIDLALSHKWKVEIAYVYRDLEIALYGAIQRKREVGRGVPLRQLPGNHRRVQQTILNLTTLYQTLNSTEPSIILNAMSTTTRKQPKTSTGVTVREIRSRLRKARERNEDLKKEGKLPAPTKQWSKDSLITLRKALSAKESAQKQSKHSPETS